MEIDLRNWYKVKLALSVVCGTFLLQSRYLGIQCNGKSY